jgi:hypothetical protein
VKVTVNDVPTWFQVNLATTGLGVGIGVGVGGPPLGGARLGVTVGSPEKDGEGESDGSRMKVGVGLGVAVGWTKIGSDGVLEPKLISVPSPPSDGGLER